MTVNDFDYQLPERFDLTYVDSDGSKVRPVMVHRTIYGSLERFIGVLTEHLGGAFPTWLAPVQVNVIPVNIEVHDEYSRKVVDKLKENKIRVEYDNRNEKLGYRMREAQTKKIPYQLVIGDNEVNNNLLNVRRFGSNESKTMAVEEFISQITEEIKTLKINK